LRYAGPPKLDAPLKYDRRKVPKIKFAVAIEAHPRRRHFEGLETIRADDVPDVISHNQVVTLRIEDIFVATSNDRLSKPLSEFDIEDVKA